MRAALSACLAAWLLLGASGVPAAGGSALPHHRASAPSKDPAMSNDPFQISGDRNPPPPVPPVDKNGVRYEQHLKASEAEFGQVGGILLARDQKTGQLLWSLKVYDNRRRPDLEGDAQDVFFQSMAFDPQGRLVIEDENGRRFAVDVATRSVQALKR